MCLLKIRRLFVRSMGGCVFRDIFEGRRLTRSTKTILDFILNALSANIILFKNTLYTRYTHILYELLTDNYRDATFVESQPKIQHVNEEI